MLNFGGLAKTTQGNMGLGLAIAYFTMRRQTVSLPLNDNQPYDLVVDIEDKLKKVQVKTTGFKRNGKDYAVTLKATRHNMRKVTTKRFDPESCDLVFIVTEAGDQYLIPSSEIKVKQEIVLSDKYKSFKL